MSTLTLRVDDKTKSDLDAFCNELGMNLTTFFMIYIKKALREQRIPFELQANSPSISEGMRAFRQLRENAQKNGTAGMTLEEINAEIAASRRERALC